MKISNDDVIFVSGIGCSGRFPYYINTFGFHTLHGRAIPVAMGLKSNNFKKHIWVVVGDGDAFSIGLGHTLHAFRRNININILFINNSIYGLTKGQYSPTSQKGTITKSSPSGSLDYPLNPVFLALAAGCTFVARGFDNDVKFLEELIKNSMDHNGTSFIEILQNCIVYNDKIYSHVSDRNNRLGRVLHMNNNSELLYGKKLEFGLSLSESLELITIDSLNNHDKILLHDVSKESVVQLLLSTLDLKSVPYPIGIFRRIQKKSYFDMYNDKQINYKFITDFSDLFKLI